MPANREHATVGWGDDGAISQADHDASDAAGSEVEQPDAADLGPTSPDEPTQVPDAEGVTSDDVNRTDSDPSDDDLGQMSAADTIAWIRDAGDDEDEAARRAGVVWAVESNRDGGPRTTVEAEVDKHMEDDPNQG